MAVSKVCTPSSKYFVVKRPPGSKVQDFTNRFCFHSSKTLHDHLVLQAVDFGIALSTLFFSSSTLFGCRNLPSDLVAVYILTERQLVNAGNSSNFHISEQIKSHHKYKSITPVKNIVDIKIIEEGMLDSKQF